MEVECEHTRAWISYDNLCSGKSTGCRSCRRLPRRRERRLLSSIHASMLRRCYEPACLEYFRYGGVGIHVEEWLHSTQNFIDWAFSANYSEGLSLDRIDNAKGYFRDNLRWVTQAEQNRNKRNNVYVYWNNEKLCFTDFVKYHTNVSLSYARNLYRAGVSPQEIAAILPQRLRKRPAGI